jgi:hypothetical protein
MPTAKATKIVAVRAGAGRIAVPGFGVIAAIFRKSQCLGAILNTTALDGWKSFASPSAQDGGDTDDRELMFIEGYAPSDGVWVGAKATLP